MGITVANLGSIYANYANASLPWNRLHAYSAKLATAPDALAHAPAAVIGGAVATEVVAPARQSRASLYAYRAAVVPHHIMRLPDVMFGTGVNHQETPVSITTGNEAAAHIAGCIRSPLDSGLVGLAQGLTLLKFVANGAFFGALVGAAVCAKPETIETCAAVGAVLAATLFWLPPALCVSLTNGAFRAGTSLAKFAVVGVFYGVGYAVGTLVDRLAMADAYAAAQR